MFGPCIVFQYFVSVQFWSHLDREERAGCFALTVFLISCGSQFSAALPRSAVGWSAVCDCGFS